MAFPSDRCHNQSLLEYANARMDREMATGDQGSRTEDIDLSQSTYELTNDLGKSAFRDKISVLNITDASLEVLVLPLSYGDETLGTICARLAASESAELRWAMQEATRRSPPIVHNLKGRSDLVLYDSLNVTVSDVLLVIANVHEGVVSVLDARRVSATENMALAVLPGLLLDGDGGVPLQPGGLAVTIAEEILDRMVETPRAQECDAAAQPRIMVQLTLAPGGLGSRLFKLDTQLGDTMGSIRGHLGARGVETEQDMYICHNGKLLADDCVLSDLEFWEYRGLPAEQEDLVLLMYLLPGRVQGRLSHIPESGRVFDNTPGLTESKVFFTCSEISVLFMKCHPLSSVRHLKIYAIRENIALRAEWCEGFGREHSDFSISISSRALEDEICPLELFSEELLHNKSKLSVHPTGDETVHGYSPWTPEGICDAPEYKRMTYSFGVPQGGSLQPQWPWKKLNLPLEERDFDGKEVNDFDVRTFKKFSSRVVFVNRTSRPVHISCFPTWYQDQRVSGAGINVKVCGVEAGAAGEVDTTLRYLQGYGAVDDPCLAAFGAYETVNIANGMVREMSVVFGVESEDGNRIEYKRLKNVKGGQQVDVLQAFVNKKAKYAHPAGQPSKDALVAHFLPKP